MLVYQIESSWHWQEFLGRTDLERGAFGENVTVAGLGDDEVCIGDRYRNGEAELEVTRPRVTCFRVAMRMEEPRLPSLLVAHSRPGFYLRVLTEGRVTAGDEIIRTRRGPHALSVADIDALLYLPGHDAARLRAAIDIPALSPGWRTSFQSMLETDAGAAQPAGVAVTPPPSWPGFRTLTVTDVVRESAAATSFELAADDALPAYLSGQYLTLRARGAGDPAPVRTYSLSGDPDGGRYRISVKREAHGLVSAHLQDSLRCGDRVEVAAPRGGFGLDEGREPVLLISAGIGLTPVLAMLHHLGSVHSTREVWWIHTSPDAESNASPPRSPTCSGGCRARTRSPTSPGRGSLPADANAYVCGPERFMNDVTAALGSVGLDPARIHTERFGSVAAINPGVLAVDRPPPHQPTGSPGTGPAVTFARSALTAAWSDGYGSVLELAEACDVPTQWSCRSGVCHTCLTALLSGQAAYTTPPLEPPGADELLICSVRPTTDLVLDL